MDFESLSTMTVQAVRKLADSWEIKAVVAGALSILQFHAELLFLFLVVVIIDLMTKFIALSHQFLTDNNVKDPCIAQCIVAIPAAHRAGVIQSYVMKTRFIGKLIVYLLLATGSGAVDRMLILMKHPGIFLPLCIGYLAATELLSCIENLHAAKVSVAARLIEKVKSKVG